MASEKVYKIGRFDLILPSDHPLDTYQSQFRLYDRVLGDIAQLVVRKYADATAIDVGANIGESAVLICRDQDLPTLCIEGSPYFLTYLQRNLRRLPNCVEFIPCLVAAQPRSVSSKQLLVGGGTASLSQTHVHGQLDISVRRLDDIIRDHPKFASPRLIKTDTDGSDFEILLSSIEIPRSQCPTIFFEYDPTFRRNGCEESLKLIGELDSTGYKYLLVYDNFGNLLDFICQDSVARLAQLNRYLLSNLIFGRQVYYLDICACSIQDEDIARALFAHQSNIVDGAYASILAKS